MSEPTQTMRDMSHETVQDALDAANIEIERLTAENERLHRDLKRQGEVCDRLLKQADAENERLRDDIKQLTTDVVLLKELLRGKR